MNSKHVTASMIALLAAAPALAQPANDSCSSPQAISGYGQTTYDNTGATPDGPAIDCAGGSTNSDVWFAWTATATASVRFDLCTGSGFDTVLAVYAGGGCPASAAINCNDDSCGLFSSLTLDVTSGQTYMICIGGYGAGDVGAGTLSISQAPPAGVFHGPVTNPNNGHVYYLLEPGSWTDAQARAVELGGNLATIRSDDENVWVINNVQRFDNANRRVWIGLNDIETEGTFVWVSGEPVTYLNWGAGEPNNANDSEHYVQIPWFSSQWNDNSDFPEDDECFGIVEIIPVTCPADLGSTGGTAQPDGVLDNNDFIVFIDYFFNANPTADRGTTGGTPGSDGLFNNNDFIVFIDQFFAGCGD